MEPAAKPVQSHPDIPRRGADIAPVQPAPPSWRRRIVPAFLRRERVLGQVVRFGIVGVLNTLVDYGTMNLLHFALGVPLWAASAVGVAAGIANSFVWNRAWTFSSAKKDGVQRQTAVFLLVSLVGILINWSLLQLLVGATGNETFLGVNAQKTIASIVSLTWNFLGYRYLAFRSHRREA